MSVKCQKLNWCGGGNVDRLELRANAVLMHGARFARQAGGFRVDKGGKSVVEKPTDADWILRAMVAVAAADGRLDAREVELIQKVYKERTGRSVDVSGVVLAVQTYATQRDVLAELSAVAGSMSRETKEEIIRAAYLTLLADKRIAGEECKKLKDVATALQISEKDYFAIVQGIESS
jgi:tellurite resistance protein